MFKRFLCQCRLSEPARDLVHRKGASDESSERNIAIITDPGVECEVQGTSACRHRLVELPAVPQPEGPSHQCSRAQAEAGAAEHPENEAYKGHRRILLQVKTIELRIRDEEAAGRRHKAVEPDEFAAVTSCRIEPPTWRRPPLNGKALAERLDARLEAVTRRTRADSASQPKPP
jgi:hypothetical protein